MSSSASEEGAFGFTLDLIEAQSPAGGMDPGDDASSALDTGVLGDELATFEDYVGVSDLEDYYRFEVLQNSIVTQTL